MKFRSFLAAGLAVFLAGIALVAGVAAPSAASAAPGVSVDVTARVQGRYNGTTGLGTPVYPFDLLKLIQLQPGTGVGYADKLYCAERTIAASSSEDLDLAGVLTDPLGSTVTFAKVKVVMVVANAANTNNVVVGAAATNTWTGPFGGATHTVAVQPGSALMLTHAGAGWTVTAGTGDLLKVANSSSGSGVTYQICVIGTSS